MQIWFQKLVEINNTKNKLSKTRIILQYEIPVTAKYCRDYLR